MKHWPIIAIALLAAPALAQEDEDNGNQRSAEQRADAAVRTADAQRAARPQTLAEAMAQAAAIHHSLDADHDGFVTRAEIDAWARKTSGATGDLPPPAAAMVTRMFARADTDGDGRISDAEDQAGAEASFRLADANHDGTVTAEERQAASLRAAQQLALQRSKP